MIDVEIIKQNALYKSLNERKVEHAYRNVHWNFYFELSFRLETITVEKNNRLKNFETKS